MTSWQRTDLRRAGGTHKTDVNRFSECSPAAGTHAVLEIARPSARPGDSSAGKLHQFPACREAADAPPAAETLCAQATSTPLPAHPLVVPGTLSGSVCRLTKAGGSPARVGDFPSC
jgi:hypothetical protein